MAKAGINPYEELAIGLAMTSKTGEAIYEEEPVGVQEFIESKKYLNQKFDGKRGCRPKIMEIAIAMCEDKVREAVLLLGKGCWSKDSLVTLADGTQKSMECLYKEHSLNGELVDLLNVNQETMNFITSRGAVFNSGKKRLYEVIVEDGTKLKLTMNQKLVTPDGKKRLDELSIGDSVTVADNIDVDGDDSVCTAEEARLLGYMVGDGCMCVKNSGDTLSERFTLTTGDRFLKSDFIRCLRTIDKECEPTITDTYKPKIKQKHGDTMPGGKWGIWFSSGYGLNCNGNGQRVKVKYQPCHAPNASKLIIDSGLHGSRSETKTVPDIIKKASKRLIGEFLTGYWMTDGEYTHCKDNKGTGFFQISTISEKLAYDIKYLLHKIGVSSKLRTGTKDIRTEKKTYKDYRGYAVTFQDTKSQLFFAEYVELFSYKGVNQMASLSLISASKITTAETNFLPVKYSRQIRDEMILLGYSNKTIGVLTGAGKKINLDRINNLPKKIRNKIVLGDIKYWAIRSITDTGIDENVYDITIQTDNDNERNYVVSGCVSSNSGKDYVSSILHLYGIYKALCLVDPQSYYGLAPGSPIYFVNTARNDTQAKKVFFAQFKGMLENCPWFRNKYEEPTASEVRFNKSITALSANSQAYGWLGYNTIQWVGDELAFFLTGDSEDGESRAEECWQSAYGSCQTRFPDNYKIIGITTPRYDDDFVMKKFYELMDRDDGYSVQAATWDIHPRLTKEDFKHDFIRDYRRTMRDFGAQPMGVIESFWGEPDFVEENVCETCRQCDLWQNRKLNTDDYRCRNNEECKANPYRGNGKFSDWFTPEEKDYYLHFDLSKNKDRLGFSMGHVIDHIKVEMSMNELGTALKDPAYEKYSDLTEEDRYIDKPLMNLDVIGWVDPRHPQDKEMMVNNEISYDKVYNKLILQLKDRGFNIVKVTFDQYNSVYIKQKLEDAGIDTDLISCDRTDEVPVNAKLAFTENRVEYPYCRILSREAKYLKYVNGKKVDHPKKTGSGVGSKDIWDAVACVITNCDDESSMSGFVILEEDDD